MFRKEKTEEPKEKLKLKAEAYGGKETPEEEDLEAKKDASIDGDKDEDKIEKEHPEDCKCAECAKKKEAKKGSEGGENPEESEAAAEQITPGNMTGQKQNTFVPTSNVHVSRDQPQHPNEVKLGGEQSSNIPTAKSVRPDLRKSPLFVELTTQINEMQKALTSKLEAVEKSYNDRLANMQKTISKVEEFYKSPFYKAIDTEIQAEVKKEANLKEKIEKGTAKFSL